MTARYPRDPAESERLFRPDPRFTLKGLALTSTLSGRNPRTRNGQPPEPADDARAGRAYKNPPTWLQNTVKATCHIAVNVVPRTQGALSGGDSALETRTLLGKGVEHLAEKLPANGRSGYTLTVDERGRITMCGSPGPSRKLTYDITR
ncbi:hypothetical protein FQR65_LT20517 [Abscondita terminalis]|nr:hypothetical protein FQR65_LT20517 [Abscondita terminalis]